MKGWHAKKYAKQYKSDGEYTKPQFPLQFPDSVSVKSCRDRALYIYLHFNIIPIPCLHTFWPAIPTFYYVLVSIVC